jgi:hypothetical protein
MGAFAVQFFGGSVEARVHYEKRALGARFVDTVEVAG